MELAVALGAILLLAGGGAGACGPQLPEGCVCADASTRLRCRAAGLTSLPPLHDRLIELDVSGNNITALPPGALQPAASLRDLNLSANRLEAAAGALSGAALLRLWLDACALRRLPDASWPHLQLL
ncbi:unnamed protein product [Parnassius apollo]|uniref:(apollo) hypothetical protein n=1 Tax=Parnassius apollo TaxID=110799 RepID=A0A8S3XS47_PARAO|nr:unnamed protein product [Parnassius apollo]